MKCLSLCSSGCLAAVVRGGAQPSRVRVASRRANRRKAICDASSRQRKLMPAPKRMRAYTSYTTKNIYTGSEKKKRRRRRRRKEKKKRLRATPRLDPMRQLHAEDRRIASFVKDDPVVGLCDIPEDWDFDTYLMLTIGIRSKEKKEKKKKRKRRKKKKEKKKRESVVFDSVLYIHTLHTYVETHYICRDTLHM